MTPAAAVLLVWAVLPVTSDADVRTVDALAARAALPRGRSEYLSADLTGDGIPEVVLVRRAPTVLTLFVVGGPVSRGATWWRMDVPADACLVPARARLGLEDARAVLAASCAPSGRGEACEVLARWEPREPGGVAPPAAEVARVVVPEPRSLAGRSPAAAPRADATPAAATVEPPPADVRARARAAVAEIAVLATPAAPAAAFAASSATSESLPDAPVAALAAPAERPRSGEVAHPALRLWGGRCAPVHVFFDGESLRSWQAVAPTP